MYNPDTLLTKINSFIEQLQYIRRPQELYKPIQYTLHQSGKRVRPVLLLLAYNMYKESVENALYAAASIETYHNYTLLHDDVMDRADMRRGEPTVVSKWGENAAILSGDTMLVLAYEFLSRVEDEKLRSCLVLFNETAKEIGEGQQLDLEFETLPSVTQQQYMEMIRLKTSVLMAAAMKMGGLLSNAPHKDLENLYALGETVGLAFQLQDDLLDVYGDTKLFGKKIGGDILCNKKTFLLIKTMELASHNELEMINEWMNRTPFDKTEKIEAFTNLYNKLNVKQICENKIEELYFKSNTYLSSLSVSEENRLVMKQYIDSLLNREL